MALAALAALWPRKWNFAMDAEFVAQNIQERRWSDAGELYHDMALSTSTYQTHNRQKLRYVQWAIAVEYLALATLTLFIIIATLIDPGAVSE